MGIGKAASIHGVDAPAGISTLRQAAVVGAITLGAVFAGIAFRLDSSLASLWPANALLLGILVRWPRLVTRQTWAGGFAAYVLADVLTGTDVRSAIELTIANVTGVAAGVLLYGLFDPAHRRLRRPGSILLLAAISAACALASALVGAGLATDLPGDGRFSGFDYRLAAELSCYLLILPLILVIAPSSLNHSLAVSRLLAPATWIRAMPALALTGSVAASAVMGGSGASPALIWCALAYGIAGTATATLTFGFMTMFGTAAGWLDFGVRDQTTSGVISIRVGVELLALGPLTLASIKTSRREAMRNLETIANSDPLTGLHNRRAFEKLGNSALDIARQSPGRVSMAMIDLDNFKHLNDAFGHQAGDRMLVLLAEVLQASLPSAAVLSRFGGDEFVALLPGASPREAQRMLAEASARFAALSTSVVESGSTISFGLTHTEGHGQTSLENLVSQADAALYAAKRRMHRPYKANTDVASTLAGRG